MTNEEYKKRNFEFITQMIQNEEAFKKCLKDILANINVPSVSNSLLSKVNELFELFENDDRPLDQHLIVILETQYLLSKCAANVIGVKQYMDKLFESLNQNDREKIASVLSDQPKHENIWNLNNREIQEFDFFNDLEKVINNGVQLPMNMSKNDALSICLKELSKVNYIPEDIRENKPGIVM